MAGDQLSAVARPDPALQVHNEWLGFVQPTGLVVSAPALVHAGAILDRRDIEGQQLLQTCVEQREFDPDEGPVPYLPDFQAFAESVLGWSFSPKFYAGTAEAAITPELEVPLPDYGETLRPDFAVRDMEAQNGVAPWQLLVRVLEPDREIDRVIRGNGQFEASPHGRMERLLRQTGVQAGLLFNGRVIRLLSAPRGESSGWLDFQVADMIQTAGRPICTALRLLLRQERLLSLPRHQRLTALLEDSRRYQNEVSERLAQQVLHSLYEFLRGFQAAHDASGGTLLAQPLREHPNEIYHGLLTVILRLVFLLYAEEREMLPEDEVYLKNYSLAGLYERLREDAALYPDTMDQRYGAWAHLLVVFRMIHDGAISSAMRLPRRHGVLFDPNRFPFLEGRSDGGARQIHERIVPPLVSDGTIYRALEKLLILDGERISYRALDVEQIGSVYETMMGFRLETGTGHSLAIKPQKRGGAPATVDLEALLEESPEKRAKWIHDHADRKLTDTVKSPLVEAGTVEDLHAALLPVIDLAASPDLMPKGAMVLQPSEERRRSGSHYTPRMLTEPIVRTTLEPILAKLRDEVGRPPRPDQILDLKVCDPAIGSGAFLVETCRQLGDALIEAWHAHDEVPSVPADEDEVVFARRLIAQRCLYGVDRNPVAVDLAKMSLWLVTLAKDHPLTFLDHALRHGDSLVGLSRRQIEAFHWDPEAPRFEAGLETMKVQDHLAKVSQLRKRIREADETVQDWELRDLWDEVQSELSKVRLFGDLVLAAFFEGRKPKEQEAKRSEYANTVASAEASVYREMLEQWRHAEPPLAPFHWDIEFTEVFECPNPGFDAIIGNPPFMGGSKISSTLGQAYLDWVLRLHEGAHGNGDIVAHFFRRTFTLLRAGGALGLIATNTIAQGDTRTTGLRWICQHGGEIFAVRRRVKWPGMAAVVVSVIHVMKGTYEGVRRLDGREVPKLTAFLFHRGGHEDPSRLAENAGKSFLGSKIYGQGFTFDDTDTKGVATPIAEMDRLITGDLKNQEVIFPYIGGEEVNTRPTHVHHRYVINFGERSEEECRRRWPELMTIVEAKVKPDRMKLADNPDGRRRKERWWQFGRMTPALDAAIAGLGRVLAISSVGQHAAFAFLPGRMVFSHALIAFPFNTHAAFCALQSRPHEIWARFFGSSMKDDLRYTPSDCFETFPFPENWDTHAALEHAGQTYYDFRAALMVKNNEGLTKTYNRFHDPEEQDPGIARLRELHAAMDRAVLDAFGWEDIPTDCEFLLDYEMDEEKWSPRRKKPWRYRWPDEVHDEVLARLLELNADRAKEEALSGVASAKTKRRKEKRKRAPQPSQSRGLFS
ncbi:MAG: Eco57I restriction-modification methylase domain-containing protein [Gammaproteobacteria bacterium]